MGIEKNYVSTHTHFETSIGDSPAKIRKMLERAIELGMKSMAITDHGFMFGVMDMYNECRSIAKNILLPKLSKKYGIDKDKLKEITNEVGEIPLKEALVKKEKLKIMYEESFKEYFDEVMENEDFKPLLGVEVYICPTKEQLPQNIKYHLVLIAKDEIGYYQLCKAMKVANTQLNKGKYPRLTHDDLKELFVGGHIVCTTACFLGEVGRAILSGFKSLAEKKKEDDEFEFSSGITKDSVVPQENIEKAKEIILFYQSVFGKENLFLEIQNHDLVEDFVVKRELTNLSKELDLPLVATNDVHYVKREDGRIRTMVRALSWKTSIDKVGEDSGEFFLRSYEEMLELFSDVPEALENTLKIADMCNITFKREMHYPVFDTNGKSEKEHLRELTLKGIEWRFPSFNVLSQEKRDEINQRIEYELDVIDKMGYNGYHLIVQDYLAMGRNDGLVGDGRGSAVGSLVCFLLGITNINPLEYGLIFERYLNTERISFPDIDSDFENQIKAIKNVEEKYGSHCTARVITYGTHGARGSIRASGRCTNKDIDFVDRIAKLVPSTVGMTLTKALEEVAELRSQYEKSPIVKELIDDALCLEGLISHTGVHAGGVIIGDRDLSEYVPLMYNEKKGIWVVQYDKNIVEASCGLLKFDFLGLITLNVMGNSVEDIRNEYDVNIDLDNIPFDDEEVFKSIFQTGKTRYVFQLDSSIMRELCIKYKPKTLEDLILIISINRPGPMQFVQSVLDVRFGRKKAKSICKEIDKVFEQTYGSPVYQEQIISLFSEVAGMSLGQADEVRSAMSKKVMDKLKKYLIPFKKALKKKGVKKEDIEQLCEELIEFAKYAFNKSHGTAYGVTAFKMGYLKHYYPSIYMSNILKAETKAEKIGAIIKECNDMGIEVLPPSVNESNIDFKATDEKTIRFGLNKVKSVGKKADSIIQERIENGRFTSVKNFIERMVDNGRDINKTTVENLALVGAFDEFGIKRRVAHDSINTYLQDYKTYKDKLIEAEEKAREIALIKANGGTTRKKGVSPTTIQKYKEKVEAPHFDNTLSEYAKIDIFNTEKELIGFYASGHPLDEYKEFNKSNFFVGDIDIDMDKTKITKKLMMVTEIKKVLTKAKKQEMAILTLEDTTGTIKAVMFHDDYVVYGHMLQLNKPLLIDGLLNVDYYETRSAKDEEDEVAIEEERLDSQIIVNKIKDLPSNKSVYIGLRNIFDLDEIKDIIDKYHGEDKLYVYFEDTNELRKHKCRVRNCDELINELKIKVNKVLVK